jgi:hypothetical protein
MADGNLKATTSSAYSKNNATPPTAKGNAGIAIVPEGPSWQQEGTILLTLDK